MPTMSPTSNDATPIEATRATQTSDPQPDHDASREARDETFTVTVTGVVTFKAREEAQQLRMQLKATYKPPVLTFRFNVELFGYSDDRKKTKTMLFFNVPRHHIAALKHSPLVDVTDARELVREHLPSGGITQLRFLLQRPGHLIEPVHHPMQALRPNSQPTRAAMLLLTTVHEFVLLVPQNTFSYNQICSLQRAVTSRPSEVDEQKVHKEHIHWLGTLYGGAGGKVVDPPAVDASTPSESGDSTVPMSSPPGYKRVTQRGDPIPLSSEDHDEADAAAASAVTPPPYLAETGLTAPTDGSGRAGEKRPLNSQGFTDGDYRRRRGKGPKLAGSGPPSPSGPLFTEGIAGPAYADVHGARLGRGSHVALISMLQQVLNGIQDLREENGAIKAQLSAIEANQRELHAQITDVHRQHTEKSRAMETASAGLGKRCDDTDKELARIEKRIEGTEGQYSDVTSEITGQVRGALRDALQGALGSV